MGQEKQVQIESHLMEKHIDPDNQPTQEIDPREFTLAYLERARENWLPLHKKAERSAGMNAEANRDAEDAFKPIDRLLDELIRLGAVATANVTQLPTRQEAPDLIA